MSRVEVIVERRKIDKSEERFSGWSVGYIRKLFKVDKELCMNHCRDVVSVVEGDMFRVFDKYWREARRMKEVLGADVAIGICSNNECIDLSDSYLFRLTMSKYKLNKLVKVWRILNKLINGKGDGKILIMSRDGIVTLGIGTCYVDLYLDEAIALSRLLIKYLHNLTRLEILWKMYEEISKVVEEYEIGLEFDIRRVEHGFYVKVDTCSVYLTSGEMLSLVYHLLNASIRHIEVE